MFRLQNNVPSTYLEQSRDFQLFCRLYDCINNGVQFDISTITDILDPNKVNDRVVKLLATRIGFITNIDIDNTVLRYILSAYPYIIKNKGTKKSIEAAVNAILHAEHSIDPAIVEIDNKPKSAADSSYEIRIYTPVRLSSKTRKALDELLKYILPAGYIYDIYPYILLDKSRNIEQKFKADTDKLIAVVGPLSTTSSIRGVSDSWIVDPNANIKSRLLNNFDTMEVVSGSQYEAAKAWDNETQSKIEIYPNPESDQNS